MYGRWLGVPPVAGARASAGTFTITSVAHALSQLVELKTGETYNGNLVSCDNFMNVNLRDVIITSKVWHASSRPPAAACSRDE